MGEMRKFLVGIVYGLGFSFLAVLLGLFLLVIILLIVRFVLWDWTFLFPAMLLRVVIVVFSIVGLVSGLLEASDRYGGGLF